MPFPLFKRIIPAVIALYFLCIYSSHAQINIVSPQTALQLVQKLAGNGVTVSNAVLTCPLTFNGKFTATSSNLNLSDGIILSSGQAIRAAGTASFFASTDSSAAGDTDLDTLLGGPPITHDACKLEFDFVPIGDTVRFRYVFGSEEYPGYACTSFNDVFGFFISGPGYNGKKNIALVPNTNIPVAINSTAGVVGTSGGSISVCNQMGTGSPFTQYYVNNNSGTTVTYNGFTTIFTAIAIVVPCSTYHLKLAIADAVDGSFDSGVFLEAGSFSSNILTVSNSGNLQSPVPYCVRGCKNGIFQFKRQKVTSLPLTIRYQIAGTAVNGTDYTTIPDSVVIPANDSVTTRTIVPLTTASGTKTVKLYVYSPFSCTSSPIIFDSSQITIYDSLYTQIATPDTGACPGGSVQIQTVGDTGFVYSWSPSTNLSSTTVKNPITTPTGNITYYVTATLPNSTCAAVHDNINISLYSAPVITTEAHDTSVCNGSNAVFSVTPTGTAPTYQWQIKNGSVFTNLTNTSPYSGVTTSTLTVSAVTPSLSGKIYRCVVSGTCNPRDTSAQATLTVLALPDVTTDPVNKTICENDNTSFAITSTGAQPAYQWQVKSGSSFTNISNGGVYSGATTSSLSITGATGSMDGYLYRCIALGKCTPGDTSASALLTVYKLPDVTTQPQNTNTCPDSPATFSITANGTYLTYQWQVNTGSGYTNVGSSNPYSGATTNILNISSAPASMNNYQYRCIVNGICYPADTSGGATLTINTLPDVTLPPHDSTVCEGSTAAFKITATGTALIYQWQINTGSGFTNLNDNATYTGSHSNTLRVSPAVYSMTGYLYRCYIWGACKPADTSLAAMLTINTLPDISSQPIDSVVCEGVSAAFQITATGTAATYQWQVNAGAGFTNISNSSLYAGVTTNTLSVTAPPASMDGYMYRCVVSGACTPSDTSDAALLTVNTLPDVTLQPKDSTVCEGSDASFSITATGTSINYQWQLNTGSGFTDISNNSTYSGATSSMLSISAIPFAMNSYQYRCIVTGICTPPDTSAAAILTVYTLPAITQQPKDSTVCEGNNAAFSITATGTYIIYQWQVNTGTGFTDIANNSTYSGAITNTLNITAATASMSGYQYRCVVTGACNPQQTSSAVALTVNTLPDVTVQPKDSTVCEGSNGAFSITATGTAITYQWQVNTGSGFNNISNNSTYAGATTGTLNVSAIPFAMNNYKYRCIVTGICTPPDTSVVATLTVNTLPHITLQPKDSTICEGSNAAFKITATGTALVYQWQVNTGSGYTNITDNSTYAGATTSTLNIAAASFAMNGYTYRCTVNGACAPSETSTAAILTINTLPDVTLQPKDSTVCEGKNGAFTITATGTAITYQWQVKTGSGVYTNIINNSTYTGATTNTLNLAAIPFAMNGYTYRCIVSGICTPPDTSNAAILTVHTLPDVTLQPKDSTVCEGSNAGFTIAATGSILLYQWQVNTGSGYSNISNNGTYAGATTNTLSITAASFAMNGYKYRCTITGACLPPDTSLAATLTVNTLPDVTLQPKDSIVCEGSDATFNITATGTGITYQWQVNTGTGFTNISNGSIYAGAKTNTLYLSAVPFALDGKTYRCIVSGVCTPPDTSSAATLTVRTLPNISLQPKDSTICVTNNASFTIAATGTAITYQWQVNTGSGYTNVTNNSTYAGATSNTLDIFAAPVSMDGYQYRCIVTGICTPPDTSLRAILFISTPPAITTPPSATQICEGGDALFSLGASGTNLKYQWQVNTGSGYVNISNSSIYSGANTNALLITGVTSSMSGYLYQCIISGDCPPSVTSGALTLLLTVFTKPAVTLQPVSSKICEGDNTSFSAGATGTGITYHWQVDTGTGFKPVINNSMYSGADTNMLHITGATINMSGYKYRCVAQGVCLPDGITQAVTLTVDTIPVVHIQPKDTTVCDGSPAAFPMLAAGTNRVYQWQINTGTGFINLPNAGIYSGVHSDTLKISAAILPMNNYQYRCIITGLCTPPDTSDIAALHINTLPDISLQPKDSIICEGNNAAFTIAATGTGITYTWQVNAGSGYTNISNNSTYAGATTNTLAVSAIPFAMNNYKYRCIVAGVCTPPDTSSVANLTVNTLPDITAQPKDSTVCEGNDATFKITATGTGITYQWQVNTGSGFANVSNNSTYTGATTNTLHLAAIPFAMNSYIYRCIVTGVCPPPDTSTVAVLTVHTLPDITAQPKDSTVCEGNDAAFNITATGTGITYQWQVNTGSGFANVSNNSTYAGVTTNTLNVSAIPFAMNTYKYRCIVTGVCTPPDTSLVANLTVNTLPNITAQPKDSTVCEGNDATFKITATGTAITYQWQVNAGAGFTNVSNNSTYSGAASNALYVSTIPFTMNNYTYRCIVTGTCIPPDTSVIVNLKVNTSPNITTNPSNNNICNGDTAHYAIIATGTSLTYQWQLDTGSGYNNIVNSALYSGATTNALSVQGVTTGMTGHTFRCIATGICTPPDTSLAASLTVYSHPAIVSQPKDTTICPDNDAFFRVVATGTLLTYRWQADTGTGFYMLVDNALYSGTTTNRLHISNAPYQMNGYQYRCTVSGICNPSVVSKVTRLKVNPQVDAIITPEGPTTFCNGGSVVLKSQVSTVNYQWQQNGNIIANGTDPKLTVRTPGTYRLIVYNGYCHTTSTPVDVVVNPLPPAHIDMTDNGIICKDSSALLFTGGMAGHTYQWQQNKIDIQGANYAYYYARNPGTYRLVVTNIFGCSNTSNPLYLEADVNPDPVINTDNIYLCTGEYYRSYQWYLDGNPIFGATTNCYLPNANGTYTVMVVNNKGCARYSKAYTLKKVIVIWPNPTSGLVNILTDETINLRVTDMEGKTLMAKANPRQIDLSSFADGIYLLKVYDRYGTLIVAERIVKGSR